LKNLLSYKGYCGTYTHYPEHNAFYGKVIGIKGLISYEGETLVDLQSDFCNAINHYLSCCEEEGIEPVKSQYELLMREAKHDNAFLSRTLNCDNDFKFIDSDEMLPPSNTQKPLPVFEIATPTALQVAY